MFRRLVVAGFALVVAGAFSAASAQERWVNVATQEVDASKGFGVVDLSKARGAYRALRVVLQSGELSDVSNIQVRYTSGQYHNETRLQAKAIHLKPGERTKVIDQGNTDKFPEGLTLCFRSGTPPVRVSVEGLQTSRGGNAPRPAVTSALSFPAACPAAPAVSVAATAPSAAPATKGPSPASGTVAAAPTLPKASTTPPGSIVGPGGAVLFGSQNVGFQRDRDVIKVGSNLGQFSRVQLRVLDADAVINEMDVVYEDGSTQKVLVNADVKQNTRTRWLDIQGDKFIKEIQFTYKPRANQKATQARVEVYGQYADGWLGPNGRGRKFNEGWVLLGAQTAGRFLRTETDVIPVGNNEGQFKRIRVTVKDRALVFDELRIVYTDNEEEVIPVKTTVAANSTYGPVDLRTGSRVIKEIRAKYRSAVFDTKAVGRGASVVEIWAQH